MAVLGGGRCGVCDPDDGRCVMRDDVGGSLVSAANAAWEAWKAAKEKDRAAMLEERAAAERARAAMLAERAAMAAYLAASEA